MVVGCCGGWVGGGGLFVGGGYLSCWEVGVDGGVVVMVEVVFVWGVVYDGLWWWWFVVVWLCLLYG